MKNLRNGFIGIFLVGLIVWGVYDYTRKQGELKLYEDVNQTSKVKTGIQSGNIAPNFNLTSLDDTKISLTDLKGKRIVLNFWATWCPPCRAEMPHIEKFYNEYKDKDVIVIGVNMSFTEESLDDISAFIQKYDVTFPIVKDEKALATDTFAVQAYPTTYMIDSDGIIRGKFQGAITYDTMKTFIDKMN